MHRASRLLAIGALVVAPVFPLLSGSPALACEESPLTVSRVLRVEDTGEIVLNDGIRLRLAGIDEDAAGGSSRPLLAVLRLGLPSQTEIYYRKADSLGPDRWGRIAAQVYLPPEQGPEPDWVQEALLSRGFARLRPAAIVASCWQRLVRMENEARGARLGLWARPENAVLKPGDMDALRASEGRRRIVEGRITGIGQGRAVFFLNFSPGRHDFLTVSISKRRAKTFQVSGLPIAELMGKQVRIRGIVTLARQARMELSMPAEIEVLD
jgi:Staphylococcal nuclease homologue